MSGSVNESRDTLDAFVRALTEQRDAVEVLYRLAEHAANILGAEGAGVSLADDHGELHPVTGINQLTTELEDAEHRFRQGPCVEAFRTRSVVVVDDLDAREADWPHWSRVARARGIRSAIGVPIQARGLWMGGLNVFSLESRAWQEDEKHRLHLMVDLAAGNLLDLSELEQSMRRADQLQHALDSRVIIEQAKGVLANDFDCTVDQAFVALRSYARRRGTNLRTVAHAVVHRGLRPPRLVGPTVEHPG
jgi:transcriptional regulator with GAF, ATPase, and Fis domain